MSSRACRKLFALSYPRTWGNNLPCALNSSYLFKYGVDARRHSSSGVSAYKRKNTAKSSKGEQSTPEHSEEEILDVLQSMRRLSELKPEADFWGRPIMLSLVGFRSWTRYPNIQTFAKQIWKNTLNQFKNASSLVAIAAVNALPGVDLSKSSWSDKIRLPVRLFGTQSVKPTAWLTPLRASALEYYKELNQAIAHRDEKTIKKLTILSYREDTLKTLQKANAPGFKYVWRFHREIKPVQVMSIRTTEGYMGYAEPKVGNRLVVHALVKFETEQSLEIYDAHGRAMHTPAKSAVVEKGGRVPAEPRHVTEYLVLEKRMWYNGPWVFREQMWEIPPDKISK